WVAAPGAIEYSILAAEDGKSFVEVARTAATSWSTGPLPPGTVRSFRLRAWNASGRSPATEVLSAGTSHRPAAELLLVQAFDRFDRYVKQPDNRRAYLARHAAAIRGTRAYSLAFDAASNEAVQLGLVPLGGYRAVDWACGEESTQHSSFTPGEQQVIAAYLAGGGSLLVSGAEIGWDLEARGSAADRAFHRGVLGAAYVADDAGVRHFAAVPGGLFDGLPAGTFDDGTQ